MKTARTWMVIPALLAGGMIGLASAKLPAPPPMDPAKAAEAKAKAAEGAKKEAEALSKSMDRVAERYKKEKGIKSAPAAKKK